LKLYNLREEAMKQYVAYEKAVREKNRAAFDEMTDWIVFEYLVRDVPVDCLKAEDGIFKGETE